MIPGRHDGLLLFITSLAAAWPRTPNKVSTTKAQPISSSHETVGPDIQTPAMLPCGRCGMAGVAGKQSSFGATMWVIGQ